MSLSAEYIRYRQIKSRNTGFPRKAAMVDSALDFMAPWRWIIS